MQLNVVQPNMAQYLIKRLVRRINENADPGNLFWCVLNKRCHQISCDMPGGWLEEHEAQVIGTTFNRRVDGLLIAKTTNFYGYTHNIAL